MSGPTPGDIARADLGERGPSDEEAAAWLAAEHAASQMHALLARARAIATKAETALRETRFASDAYGDATPQLCALLDGRDSIDDAFAAMGLVRDKYDDEACAKAEAAGLALPNPEHLDDAGIRGFRHDVNRRIIEQLRAIGSLPGRYAPDAEAVFDAATIAAYKAAHGIGAR